ncbi:hypothetical protein [Streptomyces glaucescens]|uniref:hypothetical protein n=1 Tax=Streptomyces glaucescens TaxID=1907 RepID=UPI000A3B8EB1|nr:hypothetical protein [Streptomyces glaucescens]
MSNTPTLYAITATRVEQGKTVDLLAHRTVRSNQVDDTCQELRRELRPAHGESLRLSVTRH